MLAGIVTIGAAKVVRVSSADLESRIEQKTTDYAKSLGMLSLKLNVVGQVGWPDRIYVWNGHTWYVEFKAAKQKPRPIQLYIHGELAKRQAVVRVVDNLIDGRSVINELYNLPPVRP